MTTAPLPAEVRLTEPLPGLPGHESFRVVELANGHAFHALESNGEETLSMVVCDPWTFFPDYSVNVPDAIQERLELSSEADGTVLCLVILENQNRFHVNLLAPLVINHRTGQACQLVLSESAHPLRATVELAWIS